MINLFKKNIYSFLSFATITDTTTTTTLTDYKPKLQRPHQHVLGLGLINATRVSNRPMNVLESTTLKPNNNPSPSDKRVRFIDDGLMSCTESVGSESSSDERCPNEQQQQQQPRLFSLGSSRVKNDNDNDNDDNNKKDEDDDDDDCDLWRRRTMMRAEGRGYLRKVRSFPPPLSWLSRNGKPSFVLRPVRKDGRLELTEVRIQRPEILHASRHDGRLTLHLIPDHSIEEEEEEIDALLEEENILEEEELLDTILDEEMMTHDDEEEELDDDDDAKTMVDDEKEKEERVGMGGNESLRCYEMVNQHHHHHHHHHMRMSGINICVPC